MTRFVETIRALVNLARLLIGKRKMYPRGQKAVPGAPNAQAGLID